MEQKLKSLIKQLETKLKEVKTINDLNLLKSEYLGKKVFLMI